MSSFMSQARARALRPSLPLPRPRLTVVPRVAGRAPRVPFVVLVVSLLAAGLVGLLLLNTSLQRGAYQVTDLRSQAADLAIRQQNLETQVAALQQPGRLAEEAVRIGMVQNDSPAFIALRSGKVIGTPVAGVAGNQFTIPGSVVPREPGGDKHTFPVGGENTHGSSGVVEHVPERPTNPGDTRPGSPDQGNATATNNNSTTNAQQTH